MKHALERLNDFVDQIAKSIEKTTVEQEQASDWLSVAKFERKNIQTYLSRKSLKVKTLVELELTVRKFQQEISLLANRLYLISKKAGDGEKLLMPIVIELNSIVLGIQKRYSKFFDHSAKMSDVYREEVIKPDIEKQLKLIRRRLKNQVDPALIELVSSSLLESTLTYEQLEYSNTVLDRLTELPQLVQLKLIDRLTNQELITALIGENFNCSAFTSYVIQDISKGMACVDSASGKRNWLLLQRKNVRQAFYSLLIFKSKNESVRDQVCKWIDEELECIEVQMSAASVVLKELPENEKLHLGISIELLTLLVRIAKDNKVILNKNLTDIFKTLSYSCRTVKAESPTAKAMRRRYYDVNEMHIEQAQDLLHGMLNTLRKYRNDLDN